jgi:hypothetical protein
MLMLTPPPPPPPLLLPLMMVMMMIITITRFLGPLDSNHQVEAKQSLLESEQRQNGAAEALLEKNAFQVAVVI